MVPYAGLAQVIQSATRKIVKRTSIQPGAPPSFPNSTPKSLDRKRRRGTLWNAARIQDVMTAPERAGM
jgi:hypothetical protein